MQINLFHDISERPRFVPFTVDQNRYRLLDWVRGLILQKEDSYGEWHQVKILPLNQFDQNWIFYNQSFLLLLQIPKHILLQSESAGDLRLAWLYWSDFLNRKKPFANWHPNYAAFVMTIFPKYTSAG